MVIYLMLLREKENKLPESDDLGCWESQEDPTVSFHRKSSAC
jgi:hypothetical protein